MHSLSEGKHNITNTSGIYIHTLYNIRGYARLSFGVVERSKIESFLVSCTYPYAICLLVFGLLHQLIAVIRCNWGKTGRRQVHNA